MDSCSSLLANAPNFRTRSNKRSPCPCTKNQADLDDRWHSLVSPLGDEDTTIYYATGRRWKLAGTPFGEKNKMVKKVSSFVHVVICK